MVKKRIILQARTTSTRLPAKVLLPIGGLPLAILCAKRLFKCGIETVLATSKDPSDDLLSTLAKDHGLAVFRGSLENVAQRFLDCSADLADEDLIVRATADNPVTDGYLVLDMLEDFATASTDYLGPEAYVDAPYGLCVEIFRLEAFRRNSRNGLTANVAEHVTTTLRSGSAPLSFDGGRFAFPSPEQLSLTVDTLDDYLIAARAFMAQPDPVLAPWLALVDSFASLRDIPADRSR